MAWDPSLLRKYNITSHFRLLNQVRSELKDQPLQRPVAGTRSEATARRAARSSESSRRGRSGGSTTTVPGPATWRGRGSSRRRSEPRRDAAPLAFAASCGS